LEPAVTQPTRRHLLGHLAPAPAFAAEAKPAGAEALVAAARRQIGVTTQYDHGYRPIAYPGGDVPMTTGVCADVVVRAVRAAWGVDLQRLVHEDMTADFAAYPRRWGLAHPDSNIDHRRVPNLETYWDRQGARLWRAEHRVWGVDFHGALAPGDILTWRCFPNGGPHVAIVSQVGDWPRIIQNQGWGVREDWLAIEWLNAAEGHYRWRPAG
jgi:uncharacterized protein YijF (DUF1287 family)